MLTILLASTAAAADLSGRWRLEVGESVVGLVDITQADSTVTIPVPALPPSVPAYTCTGTRGASFSPLPPLPDAFRLRCSAGAPDGPLDVWLSGHTVGDDLFLATALMNLSSALYTVHGTRCQCDDGNGINGDGCDDECRIEACYSCTPPPSSVCTPLGDGATCEDGDACTTGESCTARSCGGGTAITPCVDLTGAWGGSLTVPDLAESTPFSWATEQNGGALLARNPDSGIAEWLGSIDPTTGVFFLRAGPDTVFCPGSYVQATANPFGDAFSGSGLLYSPGLPACRFGFAFTIEAARSGAAVCGDGRLSPSEECDDGNTDPGDCCDGECRLEPPGSPCPALCSACDGLGTCMPRPRSGACQTSGKTLLSVEDHAGNRRDAFVWAWKGGDEALADAFGDPTESGGFEFCVFDDTVAPANLLLGASIPAGGTCGGNPCWKGLGKPPGSRGYLYRSMGRADGQRIRDGILRMRLRSGSGGRAEIVVLGRGAMTMPSERVPATPVGEPVAVGVELRSDDGQCWAASYSDAGMSSNDPESEGDLRRRITATSFRCSRRRGWR